MSGKKEKLIIEEKLPKVQKKKSSKKKIKKVVAKQLSKLPKALALNQYLATLVDPFCCRGVRIPDESTAPSSTFSIIRRDSLTVGLNGITGVVYGYYPSGPILTPTITGGLVPYNSGIPLTNYAVGFLIPSSASTINLLPVTPTAVTLPQFNATNSTVANLFSSARLVSFGSKISYIGQALNAQGKITVARAPRETFSGKISNILTMAQVLQIPDSQVVSVPMVGSAAVMYKPEDPLSISYISCTENYPSTLNRPEEAMGNEIYVIVDGAVPNQTFFVETVWNFEGQPLTNQLTFLDSQPSKSDPIALSHANNIVADLPGTVALPSGSDLNNNNSTIKSVDLSEGSEITHHEKEQTSMLDSVIDNIGKIGSGVMKGIETISPIVSGLMAVL